jgi:protein O-mannosyl-transferase
MTASAISSRRTAVWLLLAPAILAYANSFAGVFLFDDRTVIFDDPRLGSLGAFGASLGQAIRPITKLTFLFDRWCYGSNPAGYHLLNLLLHLASGLLVYRIVLRLGSRVGARTGAGGGHEGQVAFWTALLFLVHPIATEAVTYISGRPTALMTCGYLAAFLLFLTARDEEAGSLRQAAAVLSAAACLAISLLSKEVAIVFPALLLLYEAVLGRPRRAGFGRAWLRVHVPLSAVVILFLSLAAVHSRYAFLLRYSAGLRGWYENLLTQAHAVAYAMTLFIRPWQLNFDHDLPIYTSIAQGQAAISVAVIAVFAAVGFAAARRAPLLSFGILWFFLHLLPTNSVLARYDILSERNLYLPSIGLYLAGVTASIGLVRWIGSRLPRSPEAVGSAGLAGSSVEPSAGGRLARVASAVLSVGLVLGLVGATLGRNAVYADPVVFWSDGVAKSPRKARPHTNLGFAWFMAGDMDQAIRQYRIALALDPLDPIAQRNLLEAWNRKTGHSRDGIR